ncbi:ABC-type dipeptide/oligopeptide/nickel transport system, ATPase component [Frankia canadensis]|uniref:ABC-type dipeptide/oligopeptide/nickel transport system, ATPase component n=1 Tax=Frankia canadensis TaxID=1836972 RepID=A0A2I2KQ56_9ACTN|nr:ABC transporter ATP-binding protein [Frankia canadensis]SNQ47801.1 ABC-type dipeptide/oligopeptide/nickel transport system, ATPase component [Frankia canadensis]SOU55091.1 ABC-type dipeptide/oligopeptide/nickel transport system, ATPase component [Frankia canadensis]
MTAGAGGGAELLLEVTDLRVRIGRTPVVDGVGLRVAAGERVGLIGESGSGKSITALAIIGLAPDDAVVRGSVRLRGRELVGRSDRELSRIRGAEVAMIFQEPLSALNPLMRVGRQIAEPLRVHRGYSRRAADAAALDLAERVGLPDPELLVRAYPHQLSGGQRQRVGLALALACRPALILADEPTTALDVTVQAEMLGLLTRLVDETGAALLFITHDLAVVAATTRRLEVMRAGRLVESGATADLLRTPRHPHTQALLAAARAAAWPPAGTVPPREPEDVPGPSDPEAVVR